MKKLLGRFQTPHCAGEDEEGEEDWAEELIHWKGLSRAEDSLKSGKPLVEHLPEQEGEGGADGNVGGDEPVVHFKTPKAKNQNLNRRLQARRNKDLRPRVRSACLADC